MSWAPGREGVLAMLDRHDLEIVIAFMDMATALRAQSDGAIATASDADDAGRWPDLVLADLANPTVFQR